MVDGGRQRASVALGFAVFTACASLVLASLGLSIGAGDNSYKLKAHYATANGLIENSDVYFGGVKVGTVSALQIDNDGGGVTISMSIDPKYGPVHQGATAYIRPKSLLGEKYIAMTVGDPSQPALESGSTLPDSATQVNVELDQLINTFDEPTRQELQILIKQLGTGVAGQGRATNETFQSGRQNLDSLASVTDILQQRDAELRRIIDALTKLSATLSSDQQRQTYINLLQHSDQVLRTLKAEDADIRQGIDRMDTFFQTVDAGFSGRQADLSAIVTDLPYALNALSNMAATLAKAGSANIPTLERVIPGFVEGPIIFGSQPDNPSAFTSDVFTRVMPSQGCFDIDHRVDNGTRIVDTGQPNGAAPICTLPTAPADCATPSQVTSCLTALAGALCIFTGGALPICSVAGPAQPGSKPRLTGAPLRPAGAGPPAAATTQAENDLWSWLVR